ncbi:MAG: short-chain dehydrogenase [Nocardioides sp.]|nr:short-chain dehydrogenase [Nocardioides sp.]
MSSRVVPGTSAVVTGSARGIGRAVAARLVADGLRVVVADLDGEAARRTAEEIGAVEGLAQDVRDPASHGLVADAAERHGPLAVWVNNAGVGFDGDLADLSETHVRGLVDVNLVGVVWGMRTALERFHGQGELVNVASLSGLGPVPGLSLYAATKAAVVSLTSSVSMEAPRGVGVHAVLPDGVATPLLADMADDGRAKALVHSGGRILSPEEVADAVAELLGSSRVLRTLPGRRGAVMRLAALAPSVSARVMGLVTAQGRRALRS